MDVSIETSMIKIKEKSTLEVRFPHIISVQKNQSIFERNIKKHDFKNFDWFLLLKYSHILFTIPI